MRKSRQRAGGGKRINFIEFKLLYLVVLLMAYCSAPVISYADDLHSRAVAVIDATTGKLLYAKNPELRCPPASTTKLMTAIVTLENKDLKDIVAISRNAARVPPHKAGFREGERVTVEELLNAALIGSANDAAVALAEATSGSEEKFVELMNKKALSIGATNTRFINPNGLPGPGQYITAVDLARIMDYALGYPKIREIIGTRVAQVSTTDGKTKLIRNTNRLLWSEDELVGGKTGYTSKARHCFVCAAERKNDTIVVALLGSPSRSDLWKETELLIGKGFDVMGNRESPMVYLTKGDIDEPVIYKKSRGKYSKAKIKRSKDGHQKKYIAKNAKKHKKTKLYARQKSKKSKLYVKQKSKKSYGIVKRGGFEKNKG
ncbi:MAG: D-alanyl-D-alanine carboxypeptidase family protein [Thermodesulfovibrionales bacterium]